MRYRISTILSAAMLVVSCAGVANAATIAYANNAGSTGIFKFDADTGTILTSYSQAQLGHSGNGRGVVVVGNIMYHTFADNGTVFKYDLSTNTDLGVAFTVGGATGLATMAFDGTNFYLGDYSGTNNVYKYTPTGTLLATIPLANCSHHCDGLEFITLGGGKLVSNRGDIVGPYDIYNLDGTVFQSNFISGATNPTGIAFDGTFFYTSDVFGNRYGKWNSDGTFVGYINYSTSGHLVEDLSVDYNITIPPPDGNPVPEPASLLLLGAGLVALARRRISMTRSAAKS